jgi:hypothetical protein
MSRTDDDPFSAGAAEATRLAREVQELGFAAARTVVERFVEMFADFTATNGNAEAPRTDRGWVPPFWLGGSDGSMQQMQSDMLRASDAYLAVLNQLNEASMQYFNAWRWWQPQKEGRDDVTLPEVAPGGRASARLWLHNTTHETASSLRPWCPGLTAPSSASIPAGAVTCQPERIDRLEPGSSREVVVTVAVEEGAELGTYHGQLLVEGQPDLVFPLRVRVRQTTDR